MNSSSIVMAYIFSGILSLVIHHVAIGPVVFGPNKVIQKVSTDKRVSGLLQHANHKQLTVQSLKIPL